MSTTEGHPESRSACREHPCGSVDRIIEPRERDLGRFSVQRLLPHSSQQMVGPWVFFDHFGPVDFPSGEGIDIPPHPHINLATVTYLFEGEVLHRDSLGSVQEIRPGAINLMVAGKGIVHSERERPEVRNAPHRLHGLQLWHALPEQDEECAPAFFHYAADELPQVEAGGVSVRVMMGRAYGAESPVKTFAETLYAEAILKPGDKLPLPAAPHLSVYVVSGEIKIAGIGVAEHRMAVLEAGAQPVVEAESDARIAIIGGEAVGERLVEWNFVSSRVERIEKAKENWREGLFPKVPGDEADFIPLPK